MKIYLFTIKLDNGDFKLINIEALNINKALVIYNDMFKIVTPEILQITLTN